MDIALTVAIITALVSATGLILNFKTLINSRDERIRWQQKIDDKLESVDKKLEEHNGYAEKFTECATDIAEIKGKLGI